MHGSMRRREATRTVGPARAVRPRTPPADPTKRDSAADDGLREPAGAELVDDVSPVWLPELPSYESEA